MKRRDFLRITAAGSALLGGSGFLQACREGSSPDPRIGLEPAFFGLGSPDPLRVAEAAGAWLHAQAREVRSGITWPMVPGESEAASVNLYSGTPGIILFFLELYHATQDPRYLQVVRDGTFLLQGAYTEGGGWPAAAGVSPDDPTLTDPGLYTGMAGAAYTLLEVYRETGDPLVLSGAVTLLDGILGRARPVEGGLAWFQDDPNTASYDIISGSSGIGLTLLHAYDFLEEPVLMEAAHEAGAYLVARGRPAEEGLKWPMSEAYPRLMPNFSHGTAGVAYYLARLAQVTGNDTFLDAAIQGARYLRAVSQCSDDGCLIFHHEPGGEELFYLGWCHGPPGTARLFFELSRATGDPDWMEWAYRGAAALQNAGIPDTRHEGYWDNVSQCCGDAGVGDFFLALAAASESDAASGSAPSQTRSPEALGDFARELGDYVAGEARSGPVGDTGPSEGAFWPQAEHRTRPELIQAQTGWMQGAAGIGAFFLHLDGVTKGRRARVVFPDSPWGRWI